MATAIYTHQYEEAVEIYRTWITTGTVSILWGLITFPKGYVEEKITHLLLCRLCGGPQFTSAHGYHKLRKSL